MAGVDGGSALRAWGVMHAQQTNERQLIFVLVAQLQTQCVRVCVCVLRKGFLTKQMCVA